jgi:hypothetical protein
MKSARNPKGEKVRRKRISYFPFEVEMEKEEARSMKEEKKLILTPPVRRFEKKQNKGALGTSFKRS